MTRPLLMRTISRKPRIMAHLLFEPRYCWTGVFWRPGASGLHIYVCLVPMLPVKLSIALPPRHIRRLQRWSGTRVERKTRVRMERWHTFTRDIPVGRGTLGIALLLRGRREWETDIPRWYAEAWRWQDKPRGSGKRGWTMRGWFGVGGGRLRWIVYWSRPDTMDHVWTRVRG